MFQGNPFDMSIRHQRGVWILLIASILIIFAPRFFLLLEKEEEFSELILIPVEKKASWENTRKYHPWKKTRKKRKNKTFKKPTELFDPNDLSKEEWMQYGLSEKQASIVLKFTKRGIPCELFHVFEGFLWNKLNFLKFIVGMYSAAENAEVKKDIKALSTSRILVDVNNATEQDLLNIKGIGPFYARQIIKYQQQLGGFIRKEQLMEVWKMTPEMYEQIQDKISCESSMIKQLSVNQASVEELQAHPYLNWNQANSIVKMRLQKGVFKSIDEIRQSVIIDQETFEKVRPYLSL